MILTPMSKNRWEIGPSKVVYSPVFDSIDRSKMYGGQDMPPNTIAIDIEPEVTSIEVPTLNKVDGFEAYSLAHKKVLCLRFYCLHKASEGISGNGTKAKPWTNFFVALDKLKPLASLLCTEYIQLIVMPESDDITINSEFNAVWTYYTMRVIIGSLDNKTFFNIEANADIKGIYFLSQCNIKMHNNSIQAANVYRTHVDAFGVHIERIISSDILFRKSCEIVRPPLRYNHTIAYKSTIKGHDFAYNRLKMNFVINSDLKFSVMADECFVGSLISSTLDNSNDNSSIHNRKRVHIDNIYNSEINIVNAMIKDVRTLIDSTIKNTTKYAECIRLSKGSSGSPLDALGLLAIIRNSKIYYTYTALRTGNYEFANVCSNGRPDLGALVFRLYYREYFDKWTVAVSDLECHVSVGKHPSYSGVEPDNIWYCIFPPNCGLPSDCTVIKGSVCNIYCSSAGHGE